MLKALENYYKTKGILSTDFHCPFRAACQDCLQNTPQDATCLDEIENTFTEAKSAQVGSKYGESGIPRLLFVSSDPGSAIRKNAQETWENYCPNINRLPEGVRRLEMLRAERINSGGEKMSQRVAGTNALAACILTAFDSNIAAGDVMEYYAHANAAKCCLNKPERKEASMTLFKNCRKYLRGEIEILSPQILVSLGDKARKAVKYALQGDGGDGVIQKRDNADNVYICRLPNGENDVKFFWLQTPHPSSFGRVKFYKQRDGKDGGPGWCGYVDMMQQFVAENCGR